MVKVKVVDNNASPLISGQVLAKNKVCPIKEENLDLIKKYLGEDRDIMIEKDGEFIDGNNFFKEDKEKQEEDDIPFNKLFSGHYAKRADKVKDYTSDIEEVEKILNYAIKNDESKSVVEEIKDYLNELKG